MEMNKGNMEWQVTALVPYDVFTNNLLKEVA